MQSELDIHHNIERNIVKEIMRECYPKKIAPNENFVTYFIKLLLLDPNWGITDDFLTSRENVAAFVSYVITELVKNQPKLITLQMQFYFTCNMEKIDNAVKSNRDEVLERLSRMKKEILSLSDPDSPEQIEDLTKYIIHYVTLVSGLGNSLDPFVYQETLAVFRSVMNEEELKEFMTFKSSHEKLNILNQLIKVVSGIRLFNRDDEKGGADIQDLPGLLERAVLAVKEEMQNTLKNVMDKVNMLTTIVDKYYILDEQGENKENIMVCKFPTDVEEINIETVKDMLIFYRQCELFIRRIIQEVQKIEDNSNDIYDKFRYTLNRIYHIVSVKFAIPSRMVFPLFETLSDTWTELQNQVMILTRFSKILVNLLGYSKNINYNEGLYNSLLEHNRPLSDAERLRETAKYRIQSKNLDVEITNIESFPNIDDINLQYLGFCSWKLVQTKGGLIPGNPSMGVATYSHKNFVFSIPEACKEFSKRPKEMINEVLDLGRKMPHLINFLQIKQQLEQAMDIDELAQVRGDIKSTFDKKTQTKFHEHTISQTVQNYRWNIWDLKREALELADLSKRKTESTQTHKSHFINTVNTQTYEMREKEVQTRKDNYTNVPTPSTFIYGLRGRKDDKQFIINLTRPVSNY